MNPDHPAWICTACGERHARRIPTWASYHVGECGWCGAERVPVTDPRVFGCPNAPGVAVTRRVANAAPMIDDSKPRDLAEAVSVMKSTVRHLKAALSSYRCGLADEPTLAHAMMCLGRDVAALEEVGRQIEAGEIARSKISLGSAP